MASDHVRNLAWSIRLLLVALLGIGGGITIAIFANGGDADLGAPAPSAALTPAEQAYVNTIGVRILAMNDELQAISTLVSTHSRNVLELNRRGTRVETLASEMDTFRQEAPVPARFLTIDDDARAATAVALDAIAQGRKALRSFDFSGIADLIPSFDQAASSMQFAASSLESFVRQATPVANLIPDMEGHPHAIHRNLSPRWRIPRSDGRCRERSPCSTGSAGAGAWLGTPRAVRADSGTSPR